MLALPNIELTQPNVTLAPVVVNGSGGPTPQPVKGAIVRNQSGYDVTINYGSNSITILPGWADYLIFNYPINWLTVNVGALIAASASPYLSVDLVFQSDPDPTGYPQGVSNNNAGILAASIVLQNDDRETVTAGNLEIYGPFNCAGSQVAALLNATPGGANTTIQFVWCSEPVITSAIGITQTYVMGTSLQMNMLVSVLAPYLFVSIQNNTAVTQTYIFGANMIGTQQESIDVFGSLVMATWNGAIPANTASPRSFAINTPGKIKVCSSFSVTGGALTIQTTGSPSGQIVFMYNSSKTNDFVGLELCLPNNDCEVILGTTTSAACGYSGSVVNC